MSTGHEVIADKVLDSGGAAHEQPGKGRPCVVDVHAHVVVDAMVDGPDAVGADHASSRIVEGRRRLFVRGKELGSVVGEFFDPAVMLAQARLAGIHRLVLSPWVQLLPGEMAARSASRQCEVQNASLGAMVASDPLRLSALGAVPIAHPREAARVLDEACDAGLCGVELPANAAGYLGNSSLEPFWARAEARQAVLFVHPSTHGVGVPALERHYLWNTVGNPMETAIAAATLALGGVLERHPDLVVVLAHAAGALPALAGRLGHGQRSVAAARGALVEPIRASLARFYVDSITHDPRLLRHVVEEFGAERVLCGSDRPFDMGDPDPVGTVRSAGLDPADEAAVLGGNALRLIARATGSAPVAER
ncbi:MAG: amidohydrolase family protein [Actinomycetota bacterium]|nr:amidohydrolase family protein [Actinomycetota bacterium]